MNFTRSLRLFSLVVFFSILSGFFTRGSGFPKAPSSIGRGHSPIFSSKFLISNKQEAVFSLHGYIHGSAPKFYNKIKQEVEIESLDSLVIVRQTILQEDIHPPLVLTFEEYQPQRLPLGQSLGRVHGHAHDDVLLLFVLDRAFPEPFDGMVVLSRHREGEERQQDERGE